jgi:hypothetical protein
VNVKEERLRLTAARRTVGNRSKLLSSIRKLTRFYFFLPYGWLEGREEFYPLFALNRLCKEFEFHAKKLADLSLKMAGHSDLESQFALFSARKQAMQEVHSLYVENMLALQHLLSQSNSPWDRKISAYFKGKDYYQPPPGQKSLASLKDEARALSQYHVISMNDSLKSLREAAYPGTLPYMTLEYCRKEMADSFETIRRRYAQIPFDKLHGNPKYYPLFVANALLGKLGHEIQNFWPNGPYQPEKQMRIDSLGIAIHRLNSTYRQSIRSLFDEIKAKSGDRTFLVEFPPDIYGEQWSPMDRI